MELPGWSCQDGAARMAGMARCGCECTQVILSVTGSSGQKAAKSVTITSVTHGAHPPPPLMSAVRMGCAWGVNGL